MILDILRLCETVVVLYWIVNFINSLFKWLYFSASCAVYNVIILRCLGVR